MYARLVSSERSDISGSEEVVDTHKIVVQVLDGLLARKWLKSWKVTDGLFPVQMSPSRITQFLSNMFLDPSSLEKGCQLPLVQRLSTCLARSLQLKVEKLLDVECSAVGTTLEKSGTAHPDAGQSVFVA